MKNEDLKWTQAAVFVCTKCAKSIDGVSKDWADDFKKEMKSELRSRDWSADIRVMTSSCLDICENGQQAVAFMPNTGPAVIKVFDPLTEIESIRKEIFALKK